MRKGFTQSFTNAFMTLALIAVGCLSAHSQHTMEVLAPSSIARIFEIGTANYGPLAIPEVAGVLELTDPAEACGPVSNDLTGKIAVSDRGTCNFSIKAYEAQQAGAVAAILCNTNDETFNMAPGDFADDITIPHIMLSSSDCNVVKGAMGDGDVTIRIFFDNWGFDDVLWGDGADGGDFDDDLATSGWTTVGVSDAAALWTQAERPQTDGGCGAFYIQSPTSRNGAVFMDADNFLTGGIDCAGAGPVNSELISPIIDATDFDAVTLRFWQFNLPIGIDESNDEMGTSVQFSTDGGTTWSPSINVPTKSEQNTASDSYVNSERIGVNIPEAAGVENFRFKLIYNRARGFYNWMVDDIALVRPPNYDVVLENSFYTPLSLVTPEHHIITDTFGFSANIQNAGVMADQQVVTRVTITDQDGTEWMNQVDMRTVPPQGRDTITFMSIRPEFPVGEYMINYTLSFDGGAVDELPENNDYSYPFFVSQNTFAKENAVQADLNNSYIETRTTLYWWGNIYTISGESTPEQRQFKGVELACGTEDADGTWDTESFALYLFKWVDNNNNFPSVAEMRQQTVSPLEQHDNFELVAFASVANTGQADNELFELTMENGDWLGDDGSPISELTLDAGASYAILGEFDDNMEIGFTTVQKVDDLAGTEGVLYNPQNEQNYFSGFNGSNAVIRMMVSKIDAAEDIQLDDVQARVYPTLANDFVNIELNLNEKTEAFLSIVDMNGKVQVFNSLGEVSEFSYTQDVSNFAAGTYIVNIKTALGHKQVPIVVGK